MEDVVGFLDLVTEHFIDFYKIFFQDTSLIREKQWCIPDHIIERSPDTVFSLDVKQLILKIDDLLDYGQLIVIDIYV